MCSRKVDAGTGLALIQLSDCLGSPARADQWLAQLAERMPREERIALDVAAVSFVCPYGAVVLLSVCRHLARERGRPVQLVGLQEHVHAYLRRLDFFKAGASAVVASRPLHWSTEVPRSVASLNVLELTVVRSLREVYEATARALLIFKTWLGMDAGAAHRVACCIAEACENVIEHSRDSGVVVAQKYEFAGWTEVQLAIADLGIGIRQSLAQRLRRAGRDALWLDQAGRGRPELPWWTWGPGPRRDPPSRHPDRRQSADPIGGRQRGVRARPCPVRQPGRPERIARHPIGRHSAQYGWRRSPRGCTVAFNDGR